MLLTESPSPKGIDFQSASIATIRQPIISRERLEESSAKDKQIADLSEEIAYHRTVENNLKTVNQKLQDKLNEKTAIARHLSHLNAQLEGEITERKRVETALRQSENRLRVSQERLKKNVVALTRSNHDLEQFAYVASHDMQEPLRAITTYLSIFEDRYGQMLDSKANLFITRSIDAATRMKNLIEALLAYSQLDGAGATVETVHCALVWNQALANLDASITESQALISTDPLPVISGNPEQLTHLFQNLLGNALKFRSDRRPEIHLAVEKRGRGPATEWLFSLRDNGIGMKQEHWQRIFLIFKRLHDRTEYSGTGIGLAICKKIIERHGGRIWVESEPDRGSTFFFTLPGS